MEWKKLYGFDVCKICRWNTAWARCVAFSVEWIAFVAILMMVQQKSIVLSESYLESIDMGAFGGEVVVLLAISAVVLIVGHILFALKDGFEGYSPMKKVLGLRVVDVKTGQGIGLMQSFKRNFGVAFIGAICLLGVVCLMLGPVLLLIAWGMVAGQLRGGFRLGDKWAGTKVVSMKHVDRVPYLGVPICDVCGYDLRATSRDECPECGEAISEQKQKVIEQVSGEMGAEI